MYVCLVGLAVRQELIPHCKAPVLCLVAQSCLALCNPMDSVSGLLSLWAFSRQEYWSGLPCPPPRDLPNPGIEPRFPALQEDSLPSEPAGKQLHTNKNSVKKPSHLGRRRLSRSQ